MFKTMYTKLLFFFLMVSVLPIVIVGYISFQSESNALTGQLEQSLSILAKNLSIEMEQFVFEQMANVSFLAKNDVLCDRNSTPDEIRTVLKNFTGVYKHYSGAVFVDTDGVVIACTNDDPSNPIPIEGKNIGERLWFKSAIQGDTYFSDVYYSPLVNKPMLVLAAPVRDGDGRIIGVVSPDINLAYFWSTVDRFAEQRKSMSLSGHAFIINGKGDIIAHYDRTKILKDNFFDSHNLNSASIKELHQKKGFFYCNCTDNEEVISFAALKPVQNFYGNWFVGIAVPEKELYHPLEKVIAKNYLMMGSILLITVIMAVFLLQSMVRPVRNLVDATNDLAAGKKARPLKAGNDEVGRLTAAFNSMAEKLEKRDIERHQSENALRESEERYRFLVELSPDMIAVYIDYKGVFINMSGLKMLGLSRLEEFIGRNIMDFVHPDYRERIKERNRRMQEDKKVTLPIEEKFLRMDGTSMVAEVSAVPMIFHGRQAVQVVCRDITQRKQMEEQLRYLSLHDSLTGIYNRTYFEQEMSRFGKMNYLSVGLIICDVDGLKLVNDTMGHSTGDELLITAAGIIKECFRDGEVVARIGGDEFAVLLSGSNETDVVDAVHVIRDAVISYNLLNPKIPLYISVGFAVSNQCGCLTDLFKEADNNMYREKLYHSQSTRSAIVQTLMKALEARDFITEGHADRLQILVAGLSQAIGLPERKVTEMRLLAQFHDIGKVGISDLILFKPASLTQEERIEMQRHSEIGYRIAQSAPDLAPIADWILKHHECWNGKGYPLGLKGDEIPLECRILAIADAYDAMTSDRPYRKAMSKEKALAELVSHAGIQFDPELVEKFVCVLDSRQLPS